MIEGILIICLALYVYRLYIKIKQKTKTSPCRECPLKGTCVPVHCHKKTRDAPDYIANE